MSKIERQSNSQRLTMADLPRLEEKRELRIGVYQRIAGFRDEVLRPWNQEQRHNIHPDYLNNPKDQGLVSGLSENFIESYQRAMREGGFSDLFEAWETIKDTVKNRNEGNREKSRIGTNIENRERQRLFSESIKQLLPKVPLETENEEPIVSTFNPGIDQAIVRNLQQAVMRLGRKKKDQTFANVADDAITLSPKGIILFNRKGGDPIINQLIEWSDANILGFSVIPVPALDWYNDIRRIIAGNLDPRTPFGLINVSITRGQGSDRDVPTIIQALVPRPGKWINAIEEIRDIMQEFEKRFKGEPEAPLFFGHFMHYLQPVIGDVKGFEVLKRRARLRVEEIDRQIDAIIDAENERRQRIIMEAQMPGIRGVVGKIKKIFNG